MKFVLTILGVMICCNLGAQVRLVPAYPGDGSLAPRDLWQVQLDNLTGSTVELILVTEIRRAGREVYRQQSHPVLLPGNQEPFNPAWLQLDKDRFFDREIEEAVVHSGQFPPGDYQVCLLALSPRGSGEYGRDCRQLTLLANDSLAGRSEKGLRMSGRSAVEYFYSDQPFWGADASRQYVRFDLQPQLQWQDIPLGLDVFYTLGDPNWAQGANAISLQFDVPRFREQLREKLRSGVEDRAQRIQQEHALDFATEQQLGDQLSELSDTGLLRYQTLLPELEKQLENYPEKELRQLEIQARQHLATEKEMLVQKTDSLPSDSLSVKHQRFKKWEAKLAEVRQKIEAMEQLKREITAAEQALQRLRILDSRSDVIRDRHRALKSQNDSLRQMLPQVTEYADPAALKQQLRQSGLAKPSYNWLLAVEEMKLGTYRPRYSPLILSGTQANGVSLGITPDQTWRFQASLGKIQPLFLNPATPNGNHTDLPTVAAGKISWGKQNFQTYLLAALPFQKRSVQSVESINTSPESGLRLGSGLAFSWPDRGFNGQFDAAWAFLRDNNQSFPDDDGSLTNAAFQFSGQWQLSKQLQFSGIWQSIGTAYEDIGSPFSLPGMEHIDLQLEQSFWKNQMSVGLFYLRDKNRPIGFSPFTFENDQYGLQLTWQAQGWPSVTTRLGRNLLSNENNGNNTWLWNLVASHQYRVGALQLASQLSLQHTQQQLNPQLLPQFYTFMEARQQVIWNGSFTSGLAVYQNSSNQTEVLQDLKGADLQLSFKKANWLIELTGGLYQQADQATGHRLNVNIRLPITRQLQFYVQAGRQPSFLQPGAYHLVRSGISGQF